MPKKAAPKQKQKAAAVITIYRASDMTPKGRREIANWLRMHAKHIVKHGGNYSTRFTGRYLYR